MDFKNPLIFLAGAAIGSVVTWLLVKDHYESIAEAEIASTIKAFDTTVHEEARIKAEAAKEKPNLNQYRQVLQESRDAHRVDYTKGAVVDEVENDILEEDEEDPHIITKAELLEDNGYFKPVITYYSDGIFANESNEEINDISEYLGPKFDKIYFGTCESDETYFRNERLASDFTVVKDMKTYEESLQETY